MQLDYSSSCASILWTLHLPRNPVVTLPVLETKEWNPDLVSSSISLAMSNQDNGTQSLGLYLRPTKSWNITFASVSQNAFGVGGDNEYVMHRCPSHPSPDESHTSFPSLLLQTAPRRREVDRPFLGAVQCWRLLAGSISAI